MDIGLSNLSLVYVTVSFYTMAKTSSILFLLAFAFWLRLEPVSLRLTAAALTLTLGEVLTVQGETQFNVLGFFLVIAAAAVGAHACVVIMAQGYRSRVRVHRAARSIASCASLRARDSGADV